VKLTRTMQDELLSHARSEAPQEACGVLLAKLGEREPHVWLPMLNAAISSMFFEFDPEELVALHRQMDIRGEEIIGVWHSHVATPAEPSGVDARCMAPGLTHVIVSLLDDTVRAWTIKDNTISEEEVLVE